LKQSVARRLAVRAAKPFWQARYYDFNLWSEREFTGKLRYIHRNPVTRGLVDRPERWPWSSFRHYLTGEHCGVEIESRWTARARERLGIFPTAQNRKEKPRPSGARTGHPQESGPQSERATRPLSIEQHSWRVFLDLRPSKRLRFRLAVTLPQHLEVPFLRATGLEHSRYLELAFRSPVFD
jgi:hypothetical protein